MAIGRLGAGRRQGVELIEPPHHEVELPLERLDDTLYPTPDVCRCTSAPCGKPTLHGTATSLPAKASAGAAQRHRLSIAARRQAHIASDGGERGGAASLGC